MVARRELLERLAGGARVTLVSAPAGSGKTSLLRSWLAQSDIEGRVAWVSVGRRERDPQLFWVAVFDALRSTREGSQLVGALTAGRGFDGRDVVERLLDALSGLEAPLWLVLDDLHELDDPAPLGQLETLLTEAPPELRFVLATRHDLRLGFHRLRLDGQLAELRAADLRFTSEEARDLFETAGLDISGTALEQLLSRTEGWAAGLRLAALSLAGHPDPERFATEFCGSERTVAEYLLAEVLERQPEDARRLLLRTSILEQVTGALADRLTGDAGGARILDELERVGAFVVAIDPDRSTYRYHRLFADLLSLELRRTVPDELPALHAAAAEWFAEHGVIVEAIRHAQAAQRWDLATQLLSDHWLGLYLDGQRGNRHELLLAFPPEVVARNAELAAVAAADELTSGSVEGAERHLAIATRALSAVPEERRRRVEVTLATLRLLRARVRNDGEAVTTEAMQLLLLPTEEPEAIQAGLGEDLRALVLISLGTAALWTGRSLEAERYLEDALALSRRIGRPLLELGSLAHLSLAVSERSYTLAEQRSRELVNLAEAHGWRGDPVVAIAYAVLGVARLWRGRLAEAEEWLTLAEQGIRAERDPAVAVMLLTARGRLELVRGRYETSIAAFREGERAREMLAMPHVVGAGARGHLLLALLRAREVAAVKRALAELDQASRHTAEIRLVTAALALEGGRPEDAAAVIAPIIDPNAHEVVTHRWMIEALLLDATARDALGDTAAVGRSLELALDLAEADGIVLPFLLFPARMLLDRHATGRTAHAALLAELRALLAGRVPGRLAEDVASLTKPLTDAELRVLRYLPTNLPAPDIAGELFVSINTVRTHMRHIYTKLGVRQRAEAVARARELGLLAPSLVGR